MLSVFCKNREFRNVYRYSIEEIVLVWGDFCSKVVWDINIREEEVVFVSC